MPSLLLCRSRLRRVELAAQKGNAGAEEPPERPPGRGEAGALRSGRAATGAEVALERRAEGSVGASSARELPGARRGAPAGGGGACWLPQALWARQQSSAGLEGARQPPEPASVGGAAGAG